MQMKNQRMSLMPKGKQKMRPTDSEYEEFLEIINSSNVTLPPIGTNYRL